MKKPRILIIDDDPNILSMLERMLGKDYDLTLVSKASEAIEKLDNEINAFDVVITDMTIDTIDGLKVMEHGKSLDAEIPFVIITGYGTVEKAVESIKKGAFDFITKPLELERLRLSLQKAVERGELYREVKLLRHQIKDKYGFQNIIGKSKKMQEMFEIVRRVADSNSTILIQGESGTGKELIAKAVHYNSSRSNRPFIAINCAGLPEGLLESELFGHVKGAFTGAISNKKGLFVEADSGTLFLDEIGDVPFSIQTKLLRVLQEKEIKPLGSNEIIKVDVRVIVATNVDLKEAVAQKKFREDFYYRIAVIPITVPPVRERREDIILLVNYFLKKYCEENNKKLKTVTPDALNLILEYEWKGNVREIENTIERAIMISSGDYITANELPKEIRDLQKENAEIEKHEDKEREFNFQEINSSRQKDWDIEFEDTREEMPRFSLYNKRTPQFFKSKNVDQNQSLKDLLSENLDKVEREVIIQALRDSKGNRTKAAQLLNISRASLYNKMRRLDIS